MNDEQKVLKTTIVRTNHYVINQLHKLNERDRCALLIEHMEHICFPFEEEEIWVVPKVKGQ